MALAPNSNFFALLEDGIGDDSLEFIHRGASNAVSKEQQQKKKAEPSQELSPESFLQDDALIRAHDHVDNSNSSQNSSVTDVDWQLVVHKHRKQGTRSQLKELNGAAEIRPVHGVQKQDHPHDLVDNMKQQEVIDSDSKCEATEQEKQTPARVLEDEKAIVEGVQKDLNGATEFSTVQGVHRQDHPYDLVDNMEQEEVVNNDSKGEATEQEKQTRDHVLEDEKAIFKGVQSGLNDATEINPLQGVQKQDHPYDLIDNMEQQEVVNNDSKCEATEQEKQTLDNVLEDGKAIVGVQEEVNGTTGIRPVQVVQKQDHPHYFADIMEQQEIIVNDGKYEATEQEKQTLDHVLEDEKVIVGGVQKELDGATEIGSVQGIQKPDHPHDLVDNMEQHEVVDNDSRREPNEQKEQKRNVENETLDQVLEDKKVIVKKKKERTKNKKNKKRKKKAVEERQMHIHRGSLKNEFWMFLIIILLGIMLLGVLP